jgi:hypothetical protein
MTEPGLGMAENFYKALASGDTAAIQRASAPATEQISRQYDSAAKNITDNMPRSGAKDLALEENKISKAGAIGSTEASAYLGSFPALANLAGEGVGLSVNEISQALAAFQGASSSNQAAANMEGAGKAQTLGFLGSLGSSAATGAGLAVGCWIAEALWGRTNLHTIRLRVWLNEVWGTTPTGRIVMLLYSLLGRQVAAQVEKRTWVRKLVQPIFEFADRRAYAWELEMSKTIQAAQVN